MNDEKAYKRLRRSALNQSKNVNIFCHWGRCVSGQSTDCFNHLPSAKRFAVSFVVVFLQGLAESNVNADFDVSSNSGNFTCQSSTALWSNTSL